MFLRAVTLLLAMAAPVGADTTLRLSFAYLDAEGSARPVPSPDLTVTNLYTQTPLTVLAPESAPEGSSERSVTLTDADFPGPYARLRLAVSGLHLPAEDARADRDLTFAFEVILRRDLLGDAVDLKIPVILSSRKGAMKPLLGDPPIAEEVPGRFFVAQEYMAAYQATEDEVTASPGSFALHRLIARAMADFSLALTDQRGAGVQILPAEEMKRDIALYWQGDKEGRTQHLRAYGDARTFLWLDLAEVETILRKARRSGVETVQLCSKARSILDFFETHPPLSSEAGRVDQMFPNPGTLQGYLEGRRLDIKFACARPKI